MATILGRKPGGSGGGGGAPSGPAGGSLAGTYPNPTIATNAVDTAQIVDDAVDADKIDGADAADIRTVLGVSATADVVLKSLYDANTVLAADSDNTPAAVTMGASTILARLAAGNIKAASVAEIVTLLGPSMPGYELDYAQITANVTVSATAAASANDVVTTSARSYSGSETVLVEFFSPNAETGNTNGSILIANLFDGSTDLGRICQTRNVAAAQLQWPFYGARRLTPSNASHTFNIKAWKVGNNGTIAAGAGGTDTTLPAFIRVTRC